jgi:N utilization substance protein B
LATKRPGARRQARECALQALYDLDVNLRPDGPPAVELAEDVLARFWAHFAPEGGAGPETVQYTETLVRGVAQNLADIDQALQRTSQHWRLERMARVDRNVLRAAVFELQHLKDVPARVVINEAVELGKRFGTEESGAFVNGVLDRLARDVRKDDEPGGGMR